MTVAPLYEMYPETYDTGITIPITGKTSCDGVKGSALNFSRLFCSVVKKVYRVFVDHPVFDRSHVRTPETQRSSIYPYSPNEGDEQFEVGCNILNQSALLAPSLLWNEDSGEVIKFSLPATSNGRSLNIKSKMKSILDQLKSGDKVTEIQNSHESEQLVFICNDWPCALLPFMLDSATKDFTFQMPNRIKWRMNDHPSINFRRLIPLNTKWRSLMNSKTLFLIHSLEHTGPSFHQSLKNLFIGQHLGIKSVPNGCFNYNNKNNKHNKSIQERKDYSWLEIGIKHSHQIVTVSPAYAKEILQNSIVKSHLNGRLLYGIANGIDTSIWDPRTDPLLKPSCRFGVLNFVQGKKNAKEYLQRKLGLDVNERAPLFGFIGRLDKQKGVDLLLKAILKFYSQASMDPSSKSQFVLLGCGNPILESHLMSIKYWFRGKACGINLFSESLAHEITAACDFLLIPSRFEPCGLVAFSALRYGTIPIATSVGGLQDLVQTTPTNNPPLGIKISKYPVSTSGSLDNGAEMIVKSIEEALELYKSERFQTQRRRCMLKDVSWNKPAAHWEQILKSLTFDFSTAPL
eukprot:g290.t1